jgi:hypothetical protein
MIGEIQREKCPAKMPQALASHDKNAMRKTEIPAKAFAWAAAWTQLDMNSLSFSWEPPVIRSASRCFRDYDDDGFSPLVTPC